MEKEIFWAGGFLYNPETKSILLHKRDSNTKFNPDKWAFFGGKGEAGENSKEAFVREMKEELGIEISMDRLIPLCDYLNEEFDTWRYVFYVESDLQKSQMKLGEGAGFDWVPLEKIFEYDLTEKTERDIKTFLALRN